MKNVSIILSLCRLLLLPFFVWLFLRGSVGSAAVLLVLSGVIGLIQGFFAERLRASNYVGQVLGPAVDKLTQAFACILLAFQYPAYWWIFVVVMGKDLAALALGSYLLMNDIKSNTTMWIDKLCNLLFYIALAPLMMRFGKPSWLPAASLGVVVASAAVSGLCYLPGVIRVARRRHQEFMRKLGRKRKESIKPYGVSAIGVIPLSTILFASRGDPLKVNLSIIGNQPGHRFWFILWGVLCAVCFVTLFIKTFRVAHYEGKVERCLMLAAGITFIACVLTPFLPERYPRAADWHNRFAVMAAALIVLVSLLLSLHLRKVDRRLYHNAMLQWGLITCICVFLMNRTGISGLFELVLIISVSLHTYHILAQLTRSSGHESPAGEASPRRRQTVGHP